MNICRLAVLVLVVLGCGASSQEIARAKVATYSGTNGEIFQIVERVTAQDYKIGDEHDTSLITEPQWYEPEGGRESPGQDNFVTMADRSVLLSLIVVVDETEDGRHFVTITPKTFQHLNGSPKPRELKPDDPNLPPWITGRVEELYVRINNALKKYEVQQPRQ
jgi:hypothetical protein